MLWAWVLAFLTGLLVERNRAFRPLVVLGIAIMSVPAWRTFLDVLPRAAAPFVGGVTFQALSLPQLSSQYMGMLLNTLGYLAAGFIIMAYGQGFRAKQGIEGLAQRLREAGLIVGRGEGPSFRWGLALFPLLVLANIVLLMLTSNVIFQNSDETSLWANMTWFHAIAISLAAGFSEELLYRGLVMVGLAKGLWHVKRLATERSDTPHSPEPKNHAGPPIWVWLVAIVLQGLFFGFAHAGYANLQHLLFASLFGWLAGLVAWRWGIWSAITLHVMIDVFAFGIEIREGNPYRILALVWGICLALAVPIGVDAWYRLKRSAQREI